jgi:hypothetical protein
MRQITTSVATACTLLLGLAAPLSAATPATGTPPTKEGPCGQITQACKSAGFIQGDYKSGKGLWLDCIDPIVRGVAQPSTSKIPLPSVSPATVSACKQKNPKYGEKPAQPK